MSALIISFIVQMLWSLVVSGIAYLLTPKPKGEQPVELKDLDNPTAEAGRPMPVVFGDITIKSPNVLWFGEKRTEVITVS